MGRFGVPEETDFIQFLILESVVVLKELNFKFLLSMGVVVLKELILYSFYFGGCGGLERTEIYQFLLWEVWLS